MRAAAAAASAASCKMVALGLYVCFVPSKNERDLQPPAECLIKQKARLEGGNKWEPRQHYNWHKDNHAHSSIIHSSNLPHRVPQPQASNESLPCDCNLSRLCESKAAIIIQSTVR